MPTEDACLYCVGDRLCFNCRAKQERIAYLRALPDTAELKQVSQWHRLSREAATLEHYAQHGWKLQPICAACQKRGDIMRPEEIAARYSVPTTTSTILLASRMKCTTCLCPAVYFHIHHLEECRDTGGAVMWGQPHNHRGK